MRSKPLCLQSRWSVLTLGAFTRMAVRHIVRTFANTDAPQGVQNAGLADVGHPRDEHRDFVVRTVQRSSSKLCRLNRVSVHALRMREEVSEAY